jgi:hypothetical protein
MTALLKPGKSMQTLLADNRRASAATRQLSCLQPCRSFLGKLGVETASAPGNAT